MHARWDFDASSARTRNFFVFLLCDKQDILVSLKVI